MIKVELYENGDGDRSLIVPFESRETFMEQWRSLVSRHDGNGASVSLVDGNGATQGNIDMRYGYHFLATSLSSVQPENPQHLSHAAEEAVTWQSHVDLNAV